MYGLGDGFLAFKALTGAERPEAAGLSSRSLGTLCCRPVALRRFRAIMAVVYAASRRYLTSALRRKFAA